ncbi:MAG: ABC transporter permease [Rhodospirillales bacterium]|nr:ABC transporter permease [Rhodospirillales bacterium]MDE2197425.1 ABC transporter permease [Rhodospirillales bacterium]MDE2574415.1 ABC transporter permease [Rhodospirillales bacterium]
MIDAPNLAPAGAVTLELTPGRSFARRQAFAWRDVRETAQLWRLCWTLAWLDIRLRYRGSMLGPFWLTLSTGVMVAAMGVIYATLFRMDVAEYLPFLAVSQVLWGFLATLVTEACTGYTSAEFTIRSMRMPFVLYAVRILVRNLVVLAHNMLVIVVVFAVFANWPDANWLLILPAALVWLLDGVAVTLLLGVLCARFRDIPPIVGSIMQMAFFVTPVIWQPRLVGAHQWLLPFNPFYTLLEIIRAPLLGQLPNAGVYASALLTSVLLCGATWLLFTRVRDRIAFWV